MAVVAVGPKPAAQQVTPHWDGRAVSYRECVPCLVQLLRHLHGPGCWLYIANAGSTGDVHGPKLREVKQYATVS